MVIKILNFFICLWSVFKHST